MWYQESKCPLRFECQKLADIYVVFFIFGINLKIYLQKEALQKRLSQYKYYTASADARTMVGKNRQLVTDEPVQFAK